ncbi:MAG: hypothetical protein M1325_03890 [Actinobacteria bacterium]|nr:hypothetical protein [Actinomycetota bacterium]
MTVVLAVVVLALGVSLFGLVRGLDRDDLRESPRGLLSPAGLRGVVAGGFVVGLAYGLLVGRRSGVEAWNWIARGVVDGLVVACAGAFYLGFQQRRRRGGRGGRGPGNGAGGSRGL